MLVQVRPSNEALLRARVPGAQDHVGALPILFVVIFPHFAPKGTGQGCP